MPSYWSTMPYSGLERKLRQDLNAPVVVTWINPENTSYCLLLQPTTTTNKYERTMMTLLCDGWILIKSAVATFGLTLTGLSFSTAAVAVQSHKLLIHEIVTCFTPSQSVSHSQPNNQRQPSLFAELEASLPTFSFLLTRTRQSRFQFHFTFIIFSLLYFPLLDFHFHSFQLSHSYHFYTFHSSNNNSNKFRDIFTWQKQCNFRNEKL